MIHSIENSQFSVKINGVGAELCSFKSKRTGTEFIWPGKEDIWGSTAPVLFPIIGALKNNQYCHNGETYQMPKHGFIRHNTELEANKRSDSEITFSLKSNKETHKMYPFDFKFSVTFLIEKNQLKVAHSVQNTGDANLLFSLGGHPAINCPFFSGESYTDYHVDFKDRVSLDRHVLTENGLVSNETLPVLKNESQLALTETLFNNDALIFMDVPVKQAAIVSKRHKTEVLFTFADFKNLGIWAKPNAPFVCIEPWLGVADFEETSGEFVQKTGILSLAPQNVFDASFSICVKEG